MIFESTVRAFALEFQGFRTVFVAKFKMLVQPTVVRAQPMREGDIVIIQTNTYDEPLLPEERYSNRTSSTYRNLAGYVCCFCLLLFFLLFFLIPRAPGKY